MTHSHRNNPHHSLRLLTAILSYLPGLVTIPDKIVRLFRVLYDNSVSCVRSSQLMV